ncbi:gamma tubulin complex Spc97/GCP2 subunit Alp4 [Coemansia interrupta]|uniref:Spindle pole body component n=1 Tax=Coemansia interrupta TaxID=1126814 RepID=A0A9W8LK36_9FUNG|nr:gamma tubulin complex Spc97/GCP2 subunit Alp4 [Coemansia interrupta]
MSSQNYIDHDDYADFNRVSYSGHPYGSELDIDRGYSQPAIRRLKRDRADSVSFSPYDTYGELSHSETGDSAEELTPYAGNKHHQFESSFRNARGRERAPLPTRMWDMQSTMEPGRVPDDTTANYYDSGVEKTELHPSLQELALIEDLLSLMMGFNGRYLSFKFEAKSPRWREVMPVEEGISIPSWFNGSIKLMVAKILPLVLMNMRVRYFTDTYSQRRAGLVNQALCAAIEQMVKRFYEELTELENLVRASTNSQPYTLQKMWLHLYPQMQNFERFSHLISEIQVKDLPATNQPVSENYQSDNDGFTTKVFSDNNENAATTEDGMPDSEDSESEYMAQNTFPEERFVVRGGYTINIIVEMIKNRGGDPTTKHLYEYLLSKAFVPFLTMLTHWLNTGEIESGRLDTSGEFMVSMDGDGTSRYASAGEDNQDSYNDKTIMPTTDDSKWCAVEERTPVFLMPYAEKIVKTGEYLNNLRRCNVELRTLEPGFSTSNADLDEMDQSSDIFVSHGRAFELSDSSPDGLINPQALMQQVDRAYLKANQAILSVMFGAGKDIMRCLGAIKQYLLFEKSDFLTHFLDLVDDEQKHKSTEMSKERLQSLLDVALHNPASVAHGDPYVEKVQVTLDLLSLLDTIKRANSDGSLDGASNSAISLHRLSRDTAAAGTSSLGLSMTGDNFVTGDTYIGFDLKLEFPQTILLTTVTMGKYKALNRFLMTLKLTEQHLLSSWLSNLKYEDPRLAMPTAGSRDGAASLDNDAKTESMRRSLLINIHTTRHRILICIQQMMYYYFWDVIEPQWEKMVGLMKKAKTMDELKDIHKQHLDVIFQQCGLTAGKLPKITVELIKRSDRFVSEVDRMISSKSALFRVANTVSDKDTTLGQRLAALDKASLGSESPQQTLAALNSKVSSINRDWSDQLKIMVRALNHYARKYDESYLTLAARLSNESDNNYA